jgi:Tfp pilus assembly protein PilV
MTLRSRYRSQKGLSLLEAVLASAIIGASFVAFFGLAGQSMASSSDARSATMCAFLAEAQMNRLLSEEWIRGTTLATPVASTNDWGELTDLTVDPSDAASNVADGSGRLYSNYSLEHPDTTSSATFPVETTGANKPLTSAGLMTTGTTFGPRQYYVTWDVLRDPWGSQMAGTAGNNYIWIRLRVRCTYHDFRARGGYHGVTLQTYKFANPA